MNIRARLTVLFFSIVGAIFILASVLIYIFSADYRQDDFYNRLMNKAINTAKLLIEVEEVDAELLRRIERDNPVSLPNEKISIYNYKNEILYSSDEQQIIKVSRDQLDRIRLDENIRFTQGDYEVLGFLYADKYDRFVIIAAATDIYGLSKLHNLRTILLIVFGASIVVVSIAGSVYAGKALQPISRVINQVDDISITSLSTRVDEGNGTDEIAHLAMTFNKMLERLEKSFLLQKNFIANASHELRTPLAAITGQLEVSLMTPRQAGEYEKVIRSVLDDIKSLNQTSDRLLMHAQADAETAKKDFTQLRIDDLLWQVRDELTKRHNEYQVFVHLSEDLDEDKKLIIAGDEQLMKAAFTNLIDNSCKYSGNHRSDIHVAYAQDELIVRFSDKGVGIPDEDLNAIFEPFHRGRNTAAFKGHGIGLALVDRIVRLHSGKIEVNSRLNEGTVFILHFGNGAPGHQVPL